VKIKGAAGEGTIKLKSKTQPSGNNISAVSKGTELYEITVKPGVEYIINYKAE
jgi:hypothetical protein